VSHQKRNFRPVPGRSDRKEEKKETENKQGHRKRRPLRRIEGERRKATARLTLPYVDKCISLDRKGRKPDKHRDLPTASKKKKKNRLRLQRGSTLLGSGNKKTHPTKKEEKSEKSSTLRRHLKEKKNPATLQTEEKTR